MVGDWRKNPYASLYLLNVAPTSTKLDTMGFIALDAYSITGTEYERAQRPIGRFPEDSFTWVDNRGLTHWGRPEQREGSS